MSQEFHHLRLTLRTVDELFAQASRNPLTRSSRWISGVDALERELRWKRLGKRPVRVTIALFEQAPKERLQAQVQEALRAYCAQRIDESRQELHDIFQRGKASLLTSGLLVLLALLLIVYLAPLFQNETALLLVTGIFTILIWVGLWEPCGIYLYEWRAPARTRTVYERLSRAEVVLVRATRPAMNQS